MPVPPNTPQLQEVYDHFQLIKERIARGSLQNVPKFQTFHQFINDHEKMNEFVQFLEENLKKVDELEDKDAINSFLYSIQLIREEKEIIIDLPNAPLLFASLGLEGAALMMNSHKKKIRIDWEKAYSLKQLILSNPNLIPSPGEYKVDEEGFSCCTIIPRLMMISEEFRFWLRESGISTLLFDELSDPQKKIWRQECQLRWENKCLEREALEEFKRGQGDQAIIATFIQQVNILLAARQEEKVNDFTQQINQIFLNVRAISLKRKSRVKRSEQEIFQDKRSSTDGLEIQFRVIRFRTLEDLLDALPPEEQQFRDEIRSRLYQPVVDKHELAHIWVLKQLPTPLSIPMSVGPLGQVAREFGYDYRLVKKGDVCDVIVDRYKKNNIPTMTVVELRMKVSRYLSNQMKSADVFDEYITKLTIAAKQISDYAWAPLLLAFSRALNVTFVVLSSQSNVPIVFKQQKPERTILLGLVDQSFYVLEKNPKLKQKSNNPRKIGDYIDKASVIEEYLSENRHVPQGPR
jgi:hypothetical protein